MNVRIPVPFIPLCHLPLSDHAIVPPKDPRPKVPPTALSKYVHRLKAHKKACTSDCKHRRSLEPDCPLAFKAKYCKHCRRARSTGSNATTSHGQLTCPPDLFSNILSTFSGTLTNYSLDQNRPVPGPLYTPSWYRTYLRAEDAYTNLPLMRIPFPLAETTTTTTVTEVVYIDPRCFLFKLPGIATSSLVGMPYFDKFERSRKEDIPSTATMTEQAGVDNRTQSKKQRKKKMQRKRKKAAAKVENAQSEGGGSGVTAATPSAPANEADIMAVIVHNYHTLMMIMAMSGRLPSSDTEDEETDVEEEYCRYGFDIQDG
ncbi:hypothetical protein CYLTODRAFT_470441 [Cylindrobasidium torrendii FP15055 ss-10]|uniref:Uncharacterized protein n=1 Tax=Cylindrobasidium torrendii FP15055 ss-10 TaxID=1314674 RepID=A0A0D7B2R3_9AGAR|nr:hypothetical protein CYLTODRAFT_470441 [Cylindrobasidium torrendii FP15055 ss-10]